MATLATAEKDIDAVLSRIQTAKEILWTTDNPKDIRVTERLARAKRSKLSPVIVIVTNDVLAGQELADHGYEVFITAVRLDTISWLSIDDSLFVDASAKQGLVTISGQQMSKKLWVWTAEILPLHPTPLAPRPGKN